MTYIPSVEDRVNDIRHRAALLMRFFEALSQEDRGGINKELDRDAAMALEDYAREIYAGAKALDAALASGGNDAPNLAN